MLPAGLEPAIFALKGRYLNQLSYRSIFVLERGIAPPWVSSVVFETTASTIAPLQVMCRERDLNPHDFTQRILSPQRLPVPPSRHTYSEWDSNSQITASKAGAYTNSATGACGPWRLCSVDLCLQSKCFTIKLKAHMCLELESNQLCRLYESRAAPFSFLDICALTGSWTPVSS